MTVMNDMKLGDELWAWVTDYGDGTYGLIGTVLPGLGHTPLIGRSEKSIRVLEPLARQHGMVLGQKVFLRKYVKVEDFP